MKNKKSLDMEKWAIRLCAVAAVSSMAVAIPLRDKKELKTVAVSASAVFWGVGSGMAFNRLLNRGLE